MTLPSTIKVKVNPTWRGRLAEGTGIDVVTAGGVSTISFDPSEFPTAVEFGTPSDNKFIVYNSTLGITQLVEGGDFPANFAVAGPQGPAGPEGPQGPTGSAGASPAGMCYLQFNGANLELIPWNGNQLNIDGDFETVPASTTLAPSGLTSATVYYIYAYMNSGTLTLENSTTGYTISSDGIPQKTGDSTRTLVGMAYASGTTTWGLVLSYFNRRRRSIKGPVIADYRTVTTTSAATVNANEARTGFLAWADEAVGVSMVGGWSVTGAAVGTAQIIYDGATSGPIATTSSVSNDGLVITDDLLFTAGYHTADLFGFRTGGTNVIFYGPATDARCRFIITFNG